MLERLRLVVLLDLVEGRLQEHLRLDRAHGALPCDGAKEPKRRHGRVAVDGIGLTELIGKDHAGRGWTCVHVPFSPEAESRNRGAAPNFEFNETPFVKSVRVSSRIWVRSI
jgi:hypothetical protein